MRILVTGAPPSVQVTEPDDFSRLSVELAGLNVAEASSVLSGAGLGQIGDSGHAWLRIPPLRALAEPPGSPSSWADGWQAMLEYARGKGWIRGDAVRAHINVR